MFKLASPLLPASAAALISVQDLARNGGLGAAEYGAIGAMVLVLGLALKLLDKLVDRLPKRAGGAVEVGRELSTISERLDRMEATTNATRAIAKETRDWHAPDATGTQTWKNPRVPELLEEIRDGIRELIAHS